MTSFTLSNFKDILRTCQVSGSEIEEIENASPDATFADLGFDSLLVYEIITTIQDDFGVRIPDDLLDIHRTVSELISYVDKRQAEGHRNDIVAS